MNDLTWLARVSRVRMMYDIYDSKFAKRGRDPSSAMTLSSKTHLSLFGSSRRPGRVHITNAVSSC